jgi:hypothetical protein
MRAQPPPDGAVIGSRTSFNRKHAIGVGRASSANLLDPETARRQRAQQLGFWPGQVEPGHPILAVEHDDLAIVDRRDIR